MSNRIFERTIYNPRERPLSSDSNQEQSQLDRTIRELVRSICGRRDPVGSSDALLLPAGFLGDGFKVDPGSTPARISLRTGIGFADGSGDVPSAIGTVVNLDDLSGVKPLVITAAQSFTVPTPDMALPRLDIVEVRYSRRTEAPASRNVLDVGTGTFTPTLLNKSLSFVLDGFTSFDASQPINYKVGAPLAVPVEPATTAGYQKVAVIRVEPGSTPVITADKIADRRRQLSPGGVVNIAVDVRLNPTNGQFAVSSVPNIVAPPGWRVKLATFFNLFGSALSSIRVQIQGPDIFTTSLLEPSVTVAAHDSQITTLLEAIRPTVVSSDLRVLGGADTVLFIAPVAVFPTPEPPFAIIGAGPSIARTIECNAFLQRWNGTTFAGDILSNPSHMSFNFTIPTLL